VDIVQPPTLSIVTTLYRSRYSFLVRVGCINGHIDGNLTTAIGAFSSGTFSNSAGASVTIGTSPLN